MDRKVKESVPGKIRQRQEAPHTRCRKCGVRDPLEGSSQLEANDFLHGKYLLCQ